MLCDLRGQISSSLSETLSSWQHGDRTEEVDASNNNISVLSEEDHSALARLPKLHSLVLSWNKSLATKEDAFLRLANLASLSLRGCNLSTVDLSGVPQLTYLDVSVNCALKDVPKSVFSLKKLEVFLASKCDIRVVPVEMKSMVTLEKLSFSHNANLWTAYIPARKNLQDFFLGLDGTPVRRACYSGKGQLCAFNDRAYIIDKCMTFFGILRLRFQELPFGRVPKDIIIMLTRLVYKLEMEDLLKRSTINVKSCMSMSVMPPSRATIFNPVVH